MEKNNIKLLVIKSILLTMLALATAPFGQAREETVKEKIVKNNKLISKQVDDLAREIDTLLSNRRGRQKNRSTVSLIGFVENREMGQFSNSGHVDIQLRLPKLEKKWQLRFSSFDNEDEFEGLGPNRNGAAPRQQKLGTSVGFANKFSKIKTLIRPRVELRNPLVSGFLLKLSSDIKFKIFTIKWRKKFFTHSADGVGQSLAIDLEKRLVKDLVFRIFNEGQYLDQRNLFSVSQGPSLLYRVSKAIGLATTLSINSFNRTPNISVSNSYQASSYHLGSYRLDMSISHKILNRVFHYQVTPYLDFAKQQRFKGNAGIILRTEIIF